MKLIDADKLIKAIEARGLECSFAMKMERLDILAIIDELQQEQPEVDLEKEIKNYTETLYHDTFGNGQGTLDEFDWDDIIQVIDDTARYFYNLNKNDA